MKFSKPNLVSHEHARRSRIKNADSSGGLIPTFLDSPFHQTHNRIGLRCNLVVVRDHDDRHPFVTIQPLQQIHDVFSSLTIEISSWLIREKERRIADQGAGDRGSLHFPAGKFARFVIQTVTESDQLQQHTRAFDVLASVEQVSKCTG